MAAPGVGECVPRASEAWPSQEWRRQPLLRDGKMGLKLRPRERQRSRKQVCTNTQESSRGKAGVSLEGTIVPRQWGLCLPSNSPSSSHLPLMENTSFQENLKAMDGKSSSASGCVHKEMVPLQTQEPSPEAPSPSEGAHLVLRKGKLVSRNIITPTGFQKRGGLSVPIYFLVSFSQEHRS